MEILEGNGKQVMKPCVATIGMFDGVHKGHRFVLAHVCDYARKQGLQAMVITFDRHPREVVQTDWRPLLLTTNEERLRLLAETGIDYVKVLHFTSEMAGMSARDFMVMMKEQLGVKVLLMGYDNRFGHDRQDTFEDYVRYGEDIGMEVKQLPSLGQRSEVEGQGPEVSSSMVRRLLAEGAVKEAAECLGYPYSITGKVVKGEHIGTGLGYPTANLQPNDSRKMIPAPGVYAVSVTVEGQRSEVEGQRTKVKGQRSKDIYMGMMNIGTRPTFGVHPQTLEVHILDYEGDLYGKEITVSFIKRLREERCFDNEEELKTQLEEDRRRVEELRIESFDLARAEPCLHELCRA